jgi:hypothetical protein
MSEKGVEPDIELRRADVAAVPIAEIVRHRRRPYSAKYRLADINANGVQVSHRPGAL